MMTPGHDNYPAPMVPPHPCQHEGDISVLNAALAEIKDTLRDLARRNPDTDLFFITGADALASILSWQNWEELFSTARFIGVSRPGYELDGKHIEEAQKELPADALTLVEVPALAISSSVGAIMRQGPHHSAQKSTRTGTPDFSTSCSKSASLVCLISSLAMVTSIERFDGDFDTSCRCGAERVW